MKLHQWCLILGTLVCLSSCQYIDEYLNPTPIDPPVETAAETPVETDAETVVEETLSEDGSYTGASPVLIEEVPLSVTLVEPDESGKNCAYITLKNNSTYTITSISVRGLLADTNSEVNFLSSDTVFPKESAPIIHGIGPDSNEEKDLVIQDLELKVFRGAGSFTVNYNFETATYTVTENPTVREAITSPVRIDDFPYEITLQEPDSRGYIYGLATFTNNSSLTVTGFTMEYLLSEINDKIVFMCFEKVLPGETSPSFPSSGPAWQSYNTKPLKYTIILEDDDGTTTYVDYDAKLNHYTASLISDTDAPTEEAP